MKEFFGWVQDSDMASVYVHLSGRDVDNAILKLYGKVTNNDKKEDEMRTRTCPRCNKENPPEQDYCMNCRLPLSEQAVMEADKKRKFELKDLIEELIKKRMEELRKEMAK